MTEAIIRDGKRATGGITEAERAEMAVLVEKYIALAFRTAPIEPAKIIPAIKSLYKVSGLKEPKVIIVSSPLVMALASSIANKASELRLKGDKSLKLPATKMAADGFAESNLPNTYFNGMAAAVAAVLDVEPPTVEHKSVMSITKSITNTTEEAKELLSLASTWYYAYQGGNMWAGYACYLAAMRDILKLKLKEFEAYQSWEDCAHNGGFRYMHEDFCMVSDFPEVLKIDDANLPHCEDGPSHKWRDGWALYHWHGIAVPESWIMDKASITPEIALKWENIEQRRAACEIVGWHNILRLLNAVTIDTHTDPQIGELIEVDIPDVGKEKFLRVMCGTGREFAIPVPSDMKTAHQANAWTWNLSVEEYNPEVRT